MNTDGIQLLLEYNYWADRRILNACARLAPEQYAAATDGSNGYGSLRATVVHLLDGESQWRMLCQGHYTNLLTDEQYAANELHEDQFPTLAALEERWRDEERQMRAYVASLDDARLTGILRYTIQGGTVRERVLWHCLYHMINHGTQHRAEAAALLTSYGQSPGDFDFTVFLNGYFKLAA